MECLLEILLGVHQCLESTVKVGKRLEAIELFRMTSWHYCAEMREGEREREREREREKERERERERGREREKLRH